MNYDKFIIDDILSESVYNVLKKYAKPNSSELDILKFLKRLIISAQNFSYKAYDDEVTNKINLYDFLSYTLVKHIFDNSQNQNYNDYSIYYIEILNSLFRNGIDLEVSQDDLMLIFAELDKIQISEGLKEFIYDTCYSKYVINQNEIFAKNLNLNDEERKYYEDKTIEVMSKYHIDYYNKDKIIDLRKINLLNYSTSEIQTILNINDVKTEGKKIK